MLHMQPPRAPPGRRVAGNCDILIRAKYDRGGILDIGKNEGGVRVQEERASAVMRFV
jgi:hypothetical protein